MVQKKTIQSFTGLKGLMLIFIVLYHQFSEILPGGSGIFNFLFVASGYLLMFSYLEGNVKPGPFLVKKIRKLWPQVLFTIVVSTLLLVILFWKEFPWYRGEALSGILFLNNIQQIVGWGSYFSRGISSPFSHLWSISIQVQFYLIWFLFLFGKKSKQKIVNMSFLIGGLTLISFILGLIYCLMKLERNQFLMGGEVHFFGFGLGMLFAIYGTLGKGKSGHENKDMAIGVLFISFVLSLFLPLTNIYMVFLSNIVISIIAGFILLYLSKDDNYFSSFFSEPILMYLGQRAFIYYLWQYPIMFFVEKSILFSSLNSFHLLLIQIPVIFLLGEISYRLIEKDKYKNWIVLASFFVLGILLFHSYTSQEDISKKEVLVKEDLGKSYNTKPNKEEIDKENAEELKEENQEKKTPYLPSRELAASIEQINARFPQYRLDVEDLEKLQNQPGIMIGDGLTVQNEKEYLRVLPRIQYNGREERQLYEVVDIVKEVSSSLGNINTPIILQFGSKADFDIETLEEIVGAADGQRIVLINVVTPEPWEESVNEKLTSVSNKYDNVFLVDWHEVAKNQTDFFVEESSEIRPAGQRLMTQLLAHTLLSSTIDEASIEKTNNLENE